VDLIFGAAADGAVYPDFPGQGQGALDVEVVGPGGMLDSLESQLGLSGPHTAEAVRIAAYMAKLRAACASTRHPFFAASFAKDPWATARLLLGWRDRLIESGWSGASIGTARVDALAEAEGAGPQLPLGKSDRLRALLAALDHEATLDLTSLTVLGGCSLLPPPWQHLVQALSGRGVRVEDSVEPSDGAAWAPSSDLRRARAFLARGTEEPLLGDGSLVLLEADTGLLAAEAVAEWLAAGTEEQLADTVVVSPDGDTALLDAMLGARGLPALGQSAYSPWRGALQVLPLAFALSWKPFNPQVLMNLLLLPRAPVAPYAARKLAAALSQEPGTGATAWARAWAEIEEHLKQQAATWKGAPDPQTQHDDWHEWTTGGLYDRLAGMPAADARHISARVGAWANRLDAGERDPLMRELVGAAGALSQAIDVLGQEYLPALLLERMITQVLTPGGQNSAIAAQAGGLRCVQRPGALWAPAARVIWWDCKGPGERPLSGPWSTSEVQTLEAHGCMIESPAAAAARINWENTNVARMAGERLILVSASFSGGEETLSHPLIQQLEPLLRPPSVRIRWRGEQLLERTGGTLAGRALPRRLSATSPLPRPCARWTPPPSAIARLASRVESATSLERLMECHLRWLLLDVLGLRRGRFAEIPSTSQLLGTLAHAVARRVLLPGPLGDPPAISQAVRAAFDALLPALAAPLLQPEHASELAEAQSRIPAAIADLVMLLRRRNLAVVATEATREAAFVDGPRVKGRLDLLVRRPAGDLGLIDLKWTRNGKGRRAEIAEGRALQLATYGAIADPGSRAAVPGAYYLLRQRRLIGERGSPVAEEEIDGERSLPETWEALLASWHAWRDLTLSGTVVALGAHDAAALVPAGLPIGIGKEPCRYCELTSLCRIGAEEV
jgi:ATP-dependent helicase/nuclease subunit B